MKTHISLDEKPDAESAVSEYDWTVFNAITDKRARVTAMLVVLWEFAGLHYKAECAAFEYAIPEFANLCNVYAEKGRELREMILQECEEVKTDNETF